MPIKYQAKYSRVWIDQESDQFIDVRGVGVIEVAQIFNAHKDVVSEIYDRAVGRSKKKLDSESLGAIVQQVMAMAPEATCFLIYLASDLEPADLQLVRTLPIGVQVSCLEQIGALTFASNGGVKNFLESVLKIITNANALTDDIKKHPLSSNGSPASGEIDPS